MPPVTREFWLNRYNQVLNKVKQYDSSQLALTNKDLVLLYEEKRYWHELCPHLEILHGAVNHRWEDEFSTYHSMWYEEKYCSDCKKQLYSKPLPNGGTDYQVTAAGLKVIHPPK
jgi:hypothetical protein